MKNKLLRLLKKVQKAKTLKELQEIKLQIPKVPFEDTENYRLFLSLNGKVGIKSRHLQTPPEKRAEQASHMRTFIKRTSRIVSEQEPYTADNYS